MAPTQEFDYEDICLSTQAPLNPIFNEFEPPVRAPTQNVQQENERTNNLNLFEEVQIPQIPQLKQILLNAVGIDTNLEDVEVLKLQVITREVGLQHLNAHVPRLRELTLDGSSISSLRDLGCAMKNLKVLKVNSCGLTTLDGVVGLKHLEELYVAKNFLRDLTPCGFLNHIKHIDARRNKLSSLEQLSFLALCGTLEHLELDNNGQICLEIDYREKVKAILPNLKKLDGVEFTSEKSKMTVEEKNKGIEQIIKEINLPPISVSRQVNASSSSSYSVSFPPKVVSPRAEGQSTTRKPVEKGKRTEFPKL